jgi:hypothetical protein
MGLKKHWQRTFIDRLVDLGLVVRHSEGHALEYEGVEPETLQLIAEEDGQRTIKWLLYPSRYTLTDEMEELLHPNPVEEFEDDEDGLEVEDVTEEELEAATGGLPPVSLRMDILVNLLQGVQMLNEEIKGLRSEVSELRKENTALTEDMQLTQRVFEESSSATAAGIRDLKALVEKTYGNIRLRDRLMELETRVSLWRSTGERLVADLSACADQEKEIKASIDLLMEQAGEGEAGRRD